MSPFAASRRLEIEGTPLFSPRLGSRSPLKPCDGGGERSKRGGRSEGSRGSRVRARRPWTELRRRMEERRWAVGSIFTLFDGFSSGSRQILGLRKEGVLA